MSIQPLYDIWMHFLDKHYRNRYLIFAQLPGSRNIQRITIRCWQLEFSHLIWPLFANLDSRNVFSLTKWTTVLIRYMTVLEQKYLRNLLQLFYRKRNNLLLWNSQIKRTRSINFDARSKNSMLCFWTILIYTINFKKKTNDRPFHLPPSLLRITGFGINKE